MFTSEERELSAKVRNREWLTHGFKETEAWKNIEGIGGLSGAVTYGTWDLPKEEQNSLKGRWLVAWNWDWIICRNYGFGSISTTMWANGNRGGKKFEVKNRPDVKFYDLNSKVSYEGETHHFRIYDPITDKFYNRHWLVIQR